MSELEDQNKKVNYLFKPVTFVIVMVGVFAGFWFASRGVYASVLACFLLVVFASVVYVKLDRVSEGFMLGLDPGKLRDKL